ncbi:MAG: STAS/SEC14 domain-containing protein [Candidatus Dactylopiibacterium carminicum]|uniref:STAS/SEC14 domain-containing protein n=1 Tax=Candidatus Dactylopiibacterium carminicum TaxID=857335 RepID=A0A272ESV9_9RHOO|nr:STAS/SEC14 domain-containing protein [Candidatus Dactylopiibacterium carminicum]KAF7600763.1 STAS/SEC14 domain-containing protein [Candidatus Dactylopiibacterium carminicum]PAS93168.1 MAG: STAS/SEC14 domain-containing protein [Candidatus Dactylopiibacterium carminicum]PAT00770.1 MAG: hypothetical protein BSR46_01345 [Candidatus Dactylopiibacterium carminicum]
MITTDVLSDRVELRAFGSITLEDCKTFEEASDYRVLFNRPIDLLLDLRGMNGLSLDVAVREWRYIRAHRGDFRHVALITDAPLLAWGAWLSQLFTDAEIGVFSGERAARRWLEARACSQ